MMKQQQDAASNSGQQPQSFLQVPKPRIRDPQKDMLRDRDPQTDLRKEVNVNKNELDLEADVEALDHEEMFQQTIKNCLPAKDAKCKQFIPDNSKTAPGDIKKVQRVAMIGPPGDITYSLRKHVEKIVEQHNKRRNKIDLDIEFIDTTHVPPYGYGKTHGWTKIIRLVPQPLVLEVTDALHALLQPGETYTGITLSDIKAGLRQIIRYHCRLSHIAAHTAILSVPYDDVLMEPDDTLKQLHAFLIPNDKQENDNADDDLQLEMDDDGNGLFESQEEAGTQLLSYIQAEYRQDVNAVLDKVLLEELGTTKNLTAWPCQSFWTVGGDDDPSTLSPLIQRLAKALSPDCNDPFVNCWVKRDKCEAVGDGPCKDQKE